MKGKAKLVWEKRGSEKEKHTERMAASSSRLSFCSSGSPLNPPSLPDKTSRLPCRSCAAFRSLFFFSELCIGRFFFFSYMAVVFFSPSLSQPLSVSRYAITSARSCGFFMPAKDIFVPGMNFFGFSRYTSSTSGVQTTPDSALALLYAKPSTVPE